MKLIVSGGIGSGKSTAVRAAMRELGWEQPAGFFTHWAGRGRGADVLHLETWTGESVPVARRIRKPEPQMNAHERKWGAGWSRDALVPEVGPIRHRRTGKGSSGLQRREQPSGLPYRLDEKAFTTMAVASLRPAAIGCPVVIDELGLLELGAAEFVRALADVMAGDGSVLLVIQQRALAHWRTLLGRHQPGGILMVEPETRDTLPGRIAALLAVKGPGGPACPPRA